MQPWIFTEIKEQRHWDITSGERLNILKDFVRFGLQHWGSDTKGNKHGIEDTFYWFCALLSSFCCYLKPFLLQQELRQLGISCWSG